MNAQLRVLQVEDSESDAALVRRLLKKAGYALDSERVDNREKMRVALEASEWDVVIADYRLPRFDAPAALAVLHETGLDIPFIVVSGAIGEQLAVEMMKSGAHDYLMKNNLARLAPAVEREIREAQIRRERRCAETRIRRELQEKEVLLKEIHHRVKNNLQIVSSLLNMQGRMVRDKQARNAFEESEHRIQAMAMIHEFLYQNSTFSRPDLVAYLGRVTDYLAASYGAPGIRCRVEGAPAYLNLDQAIPCGLIVNELVSNCYKHAFPNQRGDIRVAVTEAGNRLRIEVEDDGAGLPEDFKFSGTQSLGLQVVETLAIRQLHGTVEASKGPHACFTVTFELPAESR